MKHVIKGQKPEGMVIEWELTMTDDDVPVLKANGMPVAYITKDGQLFRVLLTRSNADVPLSDSDPICNYALWRLAQ